MKELSSAEIRDMFLRFFESKGHSIEPSQSLIPKDDPTLLWINSGVATLKKYFDGTVVPENRRITNAQKSIRTNDIENVGHTARHHTLFEMMGNFSIGDYFKEEVIPWAWELLTSPEWYGLDPEKLYVTVYPNDEDAKRIWLQTGLPADHLYEEPDNFWDIGEGPSGPDTEIFYDRGAEFNAADEKENYPGGENERYLEIWNIVFSQFNHLPGLTDNSQYPELPHKNIDTGMGLERLVSVFQNAKTNFETDLFLPIIKATENLSANIKYGDDAATDVSFKVIADHARAVTFAIGDGALPSNEGRGYIIRRLLRRAVLHGRKLGIQQIFLKDLVPVVGEIMKSYYPEVLENAEYIASVVEAEEVRFNKTLADGLTLLNRVIDEAKASDEGVIDGAVAFKLYDTYGFPYELTEESADEAGLKVDRAGFDAEMKAQQERARAARSNKGSMGVQNALLTDLKVPSKYVGWSELHVPAAKIVALIVDNELVKRAESGEAQVMFDVTPFYAEMGGQVADRGQILDENGEVVAEVTDVQNAPNGQHLHTVTIHKALQSEASYELQVDLAYHAAVSKNHTATHMLDQALRNLLGEHTTQAGSLVTEDYLRYDFTYNGAVSEEDLQTVEDLINDKIIENLPVSWVETDLESAKKLGAVAVFTEKYGEKVRVVSIGDFNAEFDGGTHANSTAELGMFKIVSEQGTGAGVRRIEAVTGRGAMNYVKEHDALLNRAAALVKAPQLSEVNDKIEALQANLKEAKRQVSSLESKLAAQAAAAAFNDVQTAGNFKIITAKLAVESMDAMMETADNWKQSYPSDVLVLAADLGDKANLLVSAAPTALEQGIKAGDLIKAIAPAIGGGGGGRPDMAKAGGKNPAGIDDALAQAAEWLAAK